MYTTLSLSDKVRRLATSLVDEYGLSQYNALDIALKVEKNEILERAFVLSDSDAEPTALEKLIHTLQDK